MPEPSPSAVVGWRVEANPTAQEVALQAPDSPVKRSMPSSITDDLARRLHAAGRIARGEDGLTPEEKAKAHDEALALLVRMGYRGEDGSLLSCVQDMLGTVAQLIEATKRARSSDTQRQ